MDRKEFIRELRRELEHIPFEERENAVNYYEEYFDEAGPEEEREVIQNLGSPKQVARQIIADYTVKDIDRPIKTPREGFSKIWMVVLAIFASPIAIPLAFAVVAVALALVISVAAVIFAFGAVVLAMVLGGILFVVAGFTLIITDVITMLYFIGAGAAMIGLGILIGYFTFFIGAKMTGGIARWLGRFLNRNKGVRTQ